MSYAGHIHFAFVFENDGKVIVTSGSDTKGAYPPTESSWVPSSPVILTKVQQ